MKYISLLASFLPLTIASLCADRKSCCKFNFGDHELCSPSNYCDCTIGCDELGQCCSDYRGYCFSHNVDDCEYGSWSEWSACSTQGHCEIGYMKRTRDVKQMGNFKSIKQCNTADLVEYEQCGDISCFQYIMKNPQNKLNYWNSMRGNYSSAIYEFVKQVGGKCDDSFIPGITKACVICPDDGSCGQYTIREDKEIPIKYETCNGIWKKSSRSYYRDSGAECNRHWFYMNTYYFHMEKNIYQSSML